MWVKEALATQLPKGKTADGLKYSIHQEKYLKVFLSDGRVPIDNSALERSIRSFCIGKKNWILIDPIRGAKSGISLYQGGWCDVYHRHENTPLQYEWIKLISKRSNIYSKTTLINFYFEIPRSFNI